MKESTIIELLQLSVKLSKKLEIVSLKVTETIEEENFDQILELTENRDRLIKLLNGVLETLSCFKQMEEHKEAYEQIQNSIQNSIKLDEKILELLESNKEILKNQISQIFKSRQKFKGYNLKNVRD